jgi:hypothetical protein
MGTSDLSTASDTSQEEHQPSQGAMAAPMPKINGAGKPSNVSPGTAPAPKGASDKYAREKSLVDNTAYVGNGTVCDADSKAGGCFLEKDKRTRLIGDLNASILMAYTNYMNACTQLKVDQLMEKDEEEMPWYLNLLIGAVFGNISAGIMGAVKSLRSVASLKTTLEGIGERLEDPALRSMVAETNEKELDSIVGTAIELAKEKGKGAIAAAAAGAKESKKGAAISYISLIENNGRDLFIDLRRKPGAMNDSDLVVYWESFEGDQHTVDAYKERIERSLSRYMGSQAKNIGRTDANPGAPTHAQEILRETRVAWLKARDGSTQLIYVGREFRGLSTGAVNNSGVGALTGSQALSLQDPIDSLDGAHLDPERRIDGFLGFVEPDMVDVALARHAATWQEEPRTYGYDFLAKQANDD